MKPISELTPEDVMGMSLADFEVAFGFRPKDALDKKWFAITGKRITDTTRAFALHMMDDINLSDVIMQ
jgi:hypothetical protein